jgi:hypothetical protein
MSLPKGTTEGNVVYMDVLNQFWELFEAACTVTKVLT